MMMNTRDLDLNLIVTKISLGIQEISKFVQFDTDTFKKKSLEKNLLYKMYLTYILVSKIQVLTPFIHL